MKVTYKVQLALWLLLVAARVQAQQTSTFEGSVHYKVAFKGYGLGGQYRYLVPDSATLQVQGRALLYQLHGGLNPQRLLRTDSGQVYVLDTVQQRAIALRDTAPRGKPVVTYLGDGGLVAGYRTQHYQITLELPGYQGQITQQVWTTNQLGYYQLAHDSSRKAMLLPGFMAYARVPGVVLKLSTPVTKNMGVELTLTATRVQVATLPKALFVLPAGYTIVPHTPDLALPQPPAEQP